MSSVLEIMGCEVRFLYLFSGGSVAICIFGLYLAVVLCYCDRREKKVMCCLVWLHIAFDHGLYNVRF